MKQTRVFWNWAVNIPKCSRSRLTYLRFIPLQSLSKRSLPSDIVLHIPTHDNTRGECLRSWPGTEERRRTTPEPAPPPARPCKRRPPPHLFTLTASSTLWKWGSGAQLGIIGLSLTPERCSTEPFTKTVSYMEENLKNMPKLNFVELAIHLCKVTILNKDTSNVTFRNPMKIFSYRKLVNLRKLLNLLDKPFISLRINIPRFMKVD